MRFQTSILWFAFGSAWLFGPACASAPHETRAPASKANASPNAETPRVEGVESEDAGPTDAGSTAAARADADVSGSEEAQADAGARSDEAALPPPEGMLLVPGGTFAMGADRGGEEDEHPAHDVTVKSFWLDRTEVTQAAYGECVAQKRCESPDAGVLASAGDAFVGPNKPVVAISWHAASAYCAFRDKRLPTEAEFERAVRGDDGRRFPWGNDAPTRDKAVYSASAPEEVARHPEGRGPYGHDDLTGNVWEWIADDYDPFAYRRATASEGKPGDCSEILEAQNQLRKEKKQGFTGSNPIPTVCEKSIRGGAYNYPPEGLRSTNRIHHPANFKLKMTGVRCAKGI